MPPRYQRPRSTPAPTLPPPPDPEPAPVAARIASRLEAWKVLVLLGLALIGTGITFANWQAGVAKVVDVDQVRAGAAAALSVSTSGTTQQLGALQVQQYELRERMARLEAHLDEMTKASDRLFDQVTEIAKRVGARQVPASATSAGPP